MASKEKLVLIFLMFVFVGQVGEFCKIIEITFWLLKRQSWHELLYGWILLNEYAMHIINITKTKMHVINFKKIYLDIIDGPKLLSTPLYYICHKKNRI